jgi:hypothetical protein
MPGYGSSAMGATASIGNVATVPGRTTPSMGASGVPSSTGSANATGAVGGTLVDDTEDALAPTLPTSDVASIGS